LNRLKFRPLDAGLMHGSIASGDVGTKYLYLLIGFF
jgi:hypothetical protein